MADIFSTPACAGTNATRFREAVCVEVNRIFDSCSDRECMEDLQVFLTATGQTIFNQSSLVRCRMTEVLDVFLTVEPVPFNRGYYAVDITYYFCPHFECYLTPVSPAVEVRGLAFHTHRVVLFGGDGDAKTYLSVRGGAVDAMPVACIKIVEPVTLASRIVDTPPVCTGPLCVIPDEIAARFDGPIVLAPAPGGHYALVTLGVFSIVSLYRPVQIMVPSYDYVLPEREGVSALAADDPCEMFQRMRFPVQQFFPDDANEAACDCD